MKRTAFFSTIFSLGVGIIGCATPQYAVRPAPVPEETVSALEIEREISRIQGQEFERQGARPIGRGETIRGFAVQPLIDRISRVTERPGLPYRASVYQDRDPNAAALADGRIYMSTGMFDYLASRGSRADELAFILGHELGHTVAQHLVKRYRLLQQQQLLISLLAAGASAATRNASAGAQQAGWLAVDAASILQSVANSGYSQQDELEADQLGIRYVIRAGFAPQAALEQLSDFERFDSPSPFLRTHPYIATRREHLQRYLTETGVLNPPPAPSFAPSPTRPSPSAALDQERRRLQEVQRLYPKGSVSWQNLQRRLDALNDR